MMPVEKEIKRITKLDRPELLAECGRMLGTIEILREDKSNLNFLLSKVTFDRDTNTKRILEGLAELSKVDLDNE